MPEGWQGVSGQREEVFTAASVYCGRGISVSGPIRCQQQEVKVELIKKVHNLAIQHSRYDYLAPLDFVGKYYDKLQVKEAE